MIPNPIHKVLSTLSTHDVRYLLMGGQACVLYGAAEFSRDCDVVILCDAQNLGRLQAALDDLAAETIAVPPFSADYLERGHAVHFRCRSADAAGMRVDVMSKLRGVAPFEQLWNRRTTVDDGMGGRFEVMSLSDLITAKKTQRDKDWPMIRRLVEAHFAAHHDSATDEQISFWLTESRTPAMLIELAMAHPSAAEKMIVERPLLQGALSGDACRLEIDLAADELKERVADREYWKPLKEELELLRHRDREG